MDEGWNFCDHDPAIEAILAPLHGRLRRGDTSVQPQIDRYLVSCISADFAHLLLHKQTVPHYFNLPDISSLAIGILDSSLDTNVPLQQIFLLLRQCTPLRRRTKRAQREVQWREESLEGLKILLRCMQGTLMGLYPTCARLVIFKARVQIYRLLRTLLVTNFARLNVCMSRIRYITKVCIMEHMCNTISDFHPGLLFVLNKNGSQMTQFSQAVYTMCDTFRNELNSQFEREHGDILATMQALEPVAHSLFERCTRSYRGVIINVTPAARDTTERLKGVRIDPSITLFNILDHIHVTRSHYVFHAAHRDILDENQINCAWYISNNIGVFTLPECVRHAQLAALNRAYFMDKARIKARYKLHLCVFCALRYACSARSKSKTSMAAVTHGKLRRDCQSGTLLCAQCNIASIVEINLLGRFLRIGSEYFTLSSCCGSIIRYTGSGLEFAQCANTRRCAQGCVQRPETGKRRGSSQQQQQQAAHKASVSAEAGISAAAIANACEDEQRRAAVAAFTGADYHGGGLPQHATAVVQQPPCEVCRQRTGEQIFSILDIPNRRIVEKRLCVRHRIPEHIARSIHDIRELNKALLLQQQQHAR